VVQSGQWTYLLRALGLALALSLVLHGGSVSFCLWTGNSGCSSERHHRRGISDEYRESESEVHPSGGAVTAN